MKRAAAVNSFGSPMPSQRRIMAKRRRVHPVSSTACARRCRARAARHCAPTVTCRHAHDVHPDRRRRSPFPLIDDDAGPGRRSRAMVVHARTLEFYRQLGFADDVVARGVNVKSAHVRRAQSDGSAEDMMMLQLTNGSSCERWCRRPIGRLRR